MAITTAQVKELRDLTGISIMQCKKALEEAGGDKEKALVILRKKGSDVSQKKSERTLGSGVVQSYVHNTNAVGVMLMLSCETDFVAKNEEFVKLAYNLAMHVAATSPEFLTADDITEDAKKVAEEVFQKEVAGKPDDLKAKILQGKIDAYFMDKVLLEQSYIKDADKTVKDLIEGATQKFGEKIEISKFIRYSIQE